MRDSDAINRFIIENSDVRGLLVRLDETWLVARARMEYPSRVRQVLGEAFAAALLLSSTIKFDGKMTLQVRGDGPINLLVVQVTGDRRVRGLAQWKSEPAGDSLQALFGVDARMIISVESDAAGQPHQGIVELAGEKLSDALRNYFVTSEQLQTHLCLAVSDKAAAGLLLQQLPAESRDGVAADSSNTLDGDVWNRTVQLANTVEDEELLELETETLLHRLYHEEEVRLFDAEPVRFECSCSRERTDGLIQGLGAAEAGALLEEQGGIAITCEFCAAQYSYDEVDVGVLFRSSVSGENPDTLH